MQFLMESVMLSLMGGFIGILVGNLVSWMIAMALDITFQLNAGAITLAFVFPPRSAFCSAGRPRARLHG